MKIRQILAASIFCLGVSSLTRAEIDIKAHPLTISDAVGNEQSNFFFTKNFGGAYVGFTGALPVKKNNGTETRNLFLLKVSDGLNHFFEGVEPGAALKKLSSFSVLKGTKIDNLLRAPESNTFTDRSIFRVPGRGLYMTTSGKGAVLLHVDTAAAPVTGAALRFPENAVNDSTRSEQFRIIFGATDRKTGSEPYVSAGTKKTSKLLKDITAGAMGSNPSQFTSLGNEVFFVADSPANHGREVYKVVASGQAAVYAAADMTPNFGDDPKQLTGSGAGLFYTTTVPNDTHTFLINSPDGTNYFFAKTQAGAFIEDATQLTASAANNDNIGFSALDTVTGKVRFGSYNNFNGLALFPEVSNIAAGTTTNPVRITSTDNYYFFGANYSGGLQYLMRWFTGGSSLEYVVDSVSHFGITNVGEIAWIKATGGSLYFTGDAFINNAVQTDILFKMDPNSGDPYATPCKTLLNNYIHGARNLHAVTDSGSVFRLYFSAPVSPTVNSEFATDSKDHGTKPWVVTAP